MRYGNLKGGTNDIKEHPWFHMVDWNKVAKKQCKPPIKVNVVLVRLVVRIRHVLLGEFQFQLAHDQSRLE